MSARMNMTRNWVPAVMAAVLLVATAAAHASTGTVTYVYTDPQGTPLAEANVSGAITATFDYAPYGSQALGAPPNGPGYTGHVNDPESGLVYMQARYYDPSVGRFLSVDPVGPSAGDVFTFNRFAYVDNNPIVRSDPTGRVAAVSGGLGTSDEVEGDSGVKVNCKVTACRFGVDANGKPEPRHTKGCDTSECDDVHQTNKSIVVGQAKALGEVTVFAAKQAVFMLIGGPVERGLARLGMFLKIGKLAKLSEAAGEMDRNGLTIAGRSMQKHGSREGSFFERVTGHENLNSSGQKMADDIIRSSGGQGVPNRFGGMDYIGDTGAGARFDGDGKFMGFLEP